MALVRSQISAIGTRLPMRTRTKFAPRFATSYAKRVRTRLKTTSTLTEQIAICLEVSMPHLIKIQVFQL